MHVCEQEKWSLPGGCPYPHWLSVSSLHPSRPRDTDELFHHLHHSIYLLSRRRPWPPRCPRSESPWLRARPPPHVGYWPRRPQPALSVRNLQKRRMSCRSGSADSGLPRIRNMGERVTLLEDQKNGTSVVGQGETPRLGACVFLTFHEPASSVDTVGICGREYRRDCGTRGAGEIFTHNGSHRGQCWRKDRVNHAICHLDWELGHRRVCLRGESRERVLTDR